MPTTRPSVPGWHPDPDDPSWLRHWDGTRWGSTRRPRPSWAPRNASAGLLAPDPGSGSGADGHPPTPRSSRRRWYLLAGGAVLFGVLLLSVPAWLGSGVTIPPRTVSDAGFTSRADAVCAEALPKLRKDRPESREETGTPAAFAARVERAAQGLTAVATDLRAIPVATTGGSAEVGHWLDDSDAYIAVGHQYADAVRAKDDARSKVLAAKGQALSKRIFVFSKGNDMPSCTF